MLEKIKDIICNCVAVDPENITLDSTLIGDLGLSSLDLAMISVEIEKEFDLSISGNDFTTVKTVGGIIEYIESHRN